jgi:hypothetical protein
MTEDFESEHLYADVSVEEQLKIVDDIKTLRQALKTMKNRSEAMAQGTRGWFDQFDKNKNNRIELTEFKNMIQQQEIKLD